MNTNATSRETQPPCRAQGTGRRDAGIAAFRSDGKRCRGAAAEAVLRDIHRQWHVAAEQEERDRRMELVSREGRDGIRVWKIDRAAPTLSRKAQLPERAVSS